jgi:hypothetical protein
VIRYLLGALAMVIAFLVVNFLLRKAVPGGQPAPLPDGQRPGEDRTAPAAGQLAENIQGSRLALARALIGLCPWFPA